VNRNGPRVSVIVMTFNRPDSLRRCLASLTRQSLPYSAFEVVVVDVSTPHVDGVSQEFAGRLRVVHHCAVNLGVAGNRNAGVAQSSAPLLAFLDDDCVADPQWLEHLLDALERQPQALVGGRVEHPDPANAFAAAGQVITEAVDAFFNRPGAEPKFLPGLNFALVRDRYLAINGCDSQFGRLAAEDRDFVDRWRLAGGTLSKCPEALVQHEHRSTLRGFIRQYFNYGRGAWRYHRLRLERQPGRLIDEAGLHLEMPRFFRRSLAPLATGLRMKVIALIGVWEVVNLAGFLWQGTIERLGKRHGN